MWHRRENHSFVLINFLKLFFKLILFPILLLMLLLILHTRSLTSQMPKILEFYGKQYSLQGWKNVKAPTIGQNKQPTIRFSLAIIALLTDGSHLLLTLAYKYYCRTKDMDSFLISNENSLKSLTNTSSSTMMKTNEILQ